MKVLNIMFFIIFVLSALLQYNDPDPFIWAALYLYGAILCYLAIKKIYNFYLYAAGLIVYAGYAAYLFFDKDGVLSWMQQHDAENIVQSMKAEKPWIEATREFFGLVILILAIVINTVWLKRKSRISRMACICFLMSLPGLINAQELSRDVKGKVFTASGHPVAGAAVTLINPGLSAGTVTDSAGSFRLTRVAVGRYNLKVSHLGYKEYVINGLVVDAGKQPVLEITLEEAIQNLQGVTVVETRNTPHIAGNRTITVEETQRFAAIFNDPARLAASFPGVTIANDQANHIVVRGNSPNSLGWRIEGVEVVNPNHLDNAGTFTDRIAHSGGGVNILSAQLLADSRLITGAFAPGSGNATAGIFDMRLRKGNNEHKEFTGQLSLIGTDIAAEGPFCKNKNSSYLVNYRYSTIGILSALGVNFGGEKTTFQDVSFNLSFPAAKGGFTIFGIGGLSSTTFAGLRDTAEWAYQKDRQDINFHSNTGIIGGTYSYSLGSRTSLKASLAASAKESGREADFLSDDFSSTNIETDNYFQQKVSGAASIMHEAGARSKLTTGINATHFNFDLLSAAGTPVNAPETQASGGGDYRLLQPWFNWKYLLRENITLNSGLHSMYFTLNNKYAIDPRASLNWELKSNQTLTFAYGINSQLQLPHLYFVSFELPDGSTANPNRKLGFTRSHQVTAGYGISSSGFSYYAEAYYQHLFNVPVSANPASTFSALNIFDEIVQDTLANEGTGRNYGIEATIEKPFSNRYYLLATASVYESKYTAADGIERDTRFNGNYAFKISGGKEIPWLRNGKSRTVGINLRSVYRGGFRETGIDEAISDLAQRTVYSTMPFAIKQDDYFRIDFRISVKKQKPCYTRTLALDIQNLTNRQNIAFRYYDTQQKKIISKYQLGIIPIISYRVEFTGKDR